MVSVKQWSDKKKWEREKAEKKGQKKTGSFGPVAYI